MINFIIPLGVGLAAGAFAARAYNSSNEVAHQFRAYRQQRDEEMDEFIDMLMEMDPDEFRNFQRFMHARRYHRY
jgi:hypothetical protein